jgi:PAS domain S-box-containing protein
VTDRLDVWYDGDLTDRIPLGIVLTDECERITFTNRFVLDKLLQKPRENVVGRHWNEVFPLVSKEDSLDKQAWNQSFGNETFLVQKHALYRSEAENGWVFLFQNVSSLEKAFKEMDLYKNLSLDLKAIFDNSYDVIYVSDGSGVTLRVSSACETLWGYKESELVGKSVIQLEQEGVFNPSVTRLVLEKKEKVTLVQTTKTGRRLIVIGIPIKDDNGQIVRVVNASRDITEISALQSELETMRQLSEGYRQEIEELRSRSELGKEIVFRSENMEKVSILARKVAAVDSNALLIGESGVGKEVFASFIHKNSMRGNSPFITVSCGANPEAILNSDLFGSEDGKLGFFEMANDGTLFFDEIDSLPPAIQVKLIRVIQEKRLTRHFGSEPVPVNVRVIGSTSRNLEELVQSGSFRRELYYLLNVIPIAIPPLRERRDDIIPLVVHFVNQWNRKYAMNKKFSPALLKQLQEYEWPGNVRELQNIVERLLVTNEEKLVGPEHLPEYIKSGRAHLKSVQVNRIISLKEAMELVEQELLEMAQRKYGSTTRIAEALGVNQSTVSRKLSRYSRS